MIIQPDGTIRFLTVAEHGQRKGIIYQDYERTVYLFPNKRQPFLLTPGHGKDIYIDWFALRFGQKEQLRRKIGLGWSAIHYGCDRAARDEVLFRPVDEVIEHQAHAQCHDDTCQYWSPPTGVKGRYAFNCILVRYRTLGLIDQKIGLTLEEVSRIYGCTRERIRQIQERAMHRLRHQTRFERLQIFQEHILDYRDYMASSIAEAVG